MQFIDARSVLVGTSGVVHDLTEVVKAEAAQRKIPMTELCRRWMLPELKKLKKGLS